MAVGAEYKAFVREQLEALGPVRIRAMFGGAGVYFDDLMFGLIAGETLYFKVDDQNRSAFEEEGQTPFMYQPPPRDGQARKAISMSYYEVPERLYDDPDEMVAWARDALSAAMRAKAGKKPKTKKRSRAG
ncbi:DNA transformation protein [Parvibaculum indicum]|uniref:TfoX/Sxy family protein n=1 Tax=Parvibaculum indicum TaxID=562969 RepID=UPI00142151A6|nr:TfoX/Sxy family protein [Parvibaculum indicum]NIJ42642.1 DNA transformation protein [Parvibaculum indicum]